MSTVWTILWILAGLYTVGQILYILTYDSIEGRGTVPRIALPQWILWTIGASIAFARHMNPLHLIWIWGLSGFIVARAHRWWMLDRKVAAIAAQTREPSPPTPGESQVK